MTTTNPTIRERAIAYVAHQMRGRIDDGTFAEVLDDLPAHLSEYVDELYDNGTMGQWRRFKSEVRKRAVDRIV